MKHRNASDQAGASMPSMASPRAGTPASARADRPAAFGLHLACGLQDTTLADPDALRTVAAEPDLETARTAFAEAKGQAAGVIPALDFSNPQAANASAAVLLALFDNARRTADRAITQQYEHEMAMLDRREASWNGVKLQYEHELALLEGALARAAETAGAADAGSQPAAGPASRPATGRANRPAAD